MTWTGVAIGAGSSLLGGLMSSDAQSSAGNLQAQTSRDVAAQQLQAARENQALQAAALKGGLQLQSPNIRGGNLALSALMSGMGLGPAKTVLGTKGPSGNVGPNGQPVGAGTGGTYMNSAGQAVDASGKPVSSMDPYGLMDTNYGATNEEMASAAAPFKDTFTEQFTPNDLTLDPSYQFRLTQGQKLLDAKRAAAGNRWGSQALRDTVDYGQGAASQEYQSAFDRFQKNKALLFDRLSGLAGIGSASGNAGSAALTSTGTSMAGTGMTGATSAGQTLLGGANAQAGANVGSTNSIVGGINSGLNNASQWYFMNKLNPGGNSTASPGTFKPDYSLWGNGVKLGG